MLANQSVPIKNMEVRIKLVAPIKGIAELCILRCGAELGSSLKPNFSESFNTIGTSKKLKQNETIENSIARKIITVGIVMVWLSSLNLSNFDQAKIVRYNRTNSDV